MQIVDDRQTDFLVGRLKAQRGPEEDLARVPFGWSGRKLYVWREEGRLLPGGVWMRVYPLRQSPGRVASEI